MIQVGGGTPLHIASQNGHVNVVLALLAVEANKDAALVFPTFFNEGDSTAHAQHVQYVHVAASLRLVRICLVYVSPSLIAVVAVAVHCCCCFCVSL